MNQRSAIPTATRASSDGLEAQPPSSMSDRIHQLELTRLDLLHQLDHIDRTLKIERAKYAQIRNQSVAIHSLPNELLALLFGLAHASLRSSRSNKADLDALKFLVETSRVCTRWRQVVLHTPLLWNTVIMVVETGFKQNLPAQEYLLAHLRRSGDAYLDGTFFFRTEDTDDVDLFFVSLGAHSRRWRRMSIDMSSADIGVIRKHLALLETPLLKHFSLNIGETSDMGPTSPRASYPTISPQIFLKGAPNLAVLRLANAAVGALHPNATLIRTLHIGGWSQSYFTWAQFKTLLESFPRLEHLSLHELCTRHYTRNPLDQPFPIDLPSLRCLRLHKPFTPIDRILPLLNLPRLEQVSLHDMEVFECPPVATVTHLFLENCPFDCRQSEQLSSIFPNLQHLSIDEYADQIYDILRPEAANRTCRWRSLGTLGVRKLVTNDVVALVNTVAARKEAQVPICTVRLDRRSRAVLRLKHRWDYLVEHTDVVAWDNAEAWPPGLGYEDHHDLL